MKFSDIPGQTIVKEKLKHAIDSGHVAHAQLFAGNEGGASLALALAYTTYLNCENKGLDACGACSSCNKMAKFVHPDISFFFPFSNTKKTQSELSSEHFLPEWRSFLLDNKYGTWIDWGKAIDAQEKQLLIPKIESRRMIAFSSMKSFEAEFKVVILWLPEYLNVYSSNGILKILEEPPPKTIFLMVTNNIEKLLPTIISRTQIVNIPTYSTSEIQNILTTSKEIDADRALTIAQITQGNLSEALAMSDEIEDTRHLSIRKWLLHCYKNDAADLVTMSEDFLKWGKESQKAFLRLAQSFLRESVISSSGAQALVSATGDQKTFVENFSKTAGWEKIATMNSEIDKAYYHLERNLNPKIVFLDTSLLISNIFLAKN